MACSYKYSSCVVWLFSGSSSVTEFKGISVNMMLVKWVHLVNIKVQRALKIPDFLAVVSQQFLEFIPWYVLLQGFLFLKTVTDWLQKWYKNLIFFLFVVDFVIHWNETAMGLHVFPIPIPPPTSLSTRSL